MPKEIIHKYLRSDAAQSLERTAVGLQVHRMQQPPFLRVQLLLCVEPHSALTCLPHSSAWRWENSHAGWQQPTRSLGGNLEKLLMSNMQQA